MVSLDDAVLARLEKGGKRFEILVDPELVELWKQDPEAVSIGDLLAIDEIWSDARAGERPTSESLENAFDATDVLDCAKKILVGGTIQLTTSQRKNMVNEKKRQIVNEIATTATDPKTKLPHPRTRIENALEEIRFQIDPFKSVERQVEDAVSALRPVIPLQFITVRLAFKVQGRDYGVISQMLRDSIQKEEWMSDGTWVCIVSSPGGMKNDLIGRVASKSPDVEVREID
ncbi:MAG: ribosome assembly factor SBDS [Euryarchaeota archaeon]|nr:ribosome assembly factor SBDS [Euryarchaeota archaeon]OUW22647.1 MAG: rRNA metabolism protein [Euryarchaeota archaeon TMED173]|tara:strand:- start:606 stop:1295 length:690 start_codon:yes stop_codon:yes gene_type:complete